MSLDNIDIEKEFEKFYEQKKNFFEEKGAYIPLRMEEWLRFYLKSAFIEGFTYAVRCIREDMENSNSMDGSENEHGKSLCKQEFKVTGLATRRASKNLECFYCKQPIDGLHKPDCLLIRKRVKIRMVVEYEIEAPNCWGKYDIEFQRNEGSWCADNAIYELQKLSEDSGCICGHVEFEYIGDESSPYLNEE